MTEQSAILFIRIDKSMGEKGKPKQIWLHGLRKYFRSRVSVCESGGLPFLARNTSSRDGALRRIYLLEENEMGKGTEADIITLFSTPGLGIILMFCALVVFILLIGLLVSVYITLMQLHLITAIVFTLGVLFLFYNGTRTKAITDETLQKHAWLPLLIPGAFIFGYAADRLGSSSLQVFALSSSTSSGNAVTAIWLFILVFDMLFVASEVVSSGSGHRKKRRRSR